MTTEHTPQGNADIMGIAVDTDRGLLVPVVRDAGDHLPERRHFFRLDQLCFRFLEVRQRV